MDKMFLTVLNMSFIGAFVISVICLARLTLKKAPKIISYCLWAVAWFRLAFPFSFESALCLLPFNASPIPPDIAIQAVPRVNIGVPFLNNALNGSLPPTTPYNSANPLQIWTAVGAYIWLFGIAAMIIYGLATYIRVKQRMASAALTEGNIYESVNVQSPFVLGIVNPKIYMPLTIMPKEREYIILHERTHISRRDHMVKFVAYFILCIHWFNPLVWAAFFLMGADMEMSCDELVLKETGSDTRKEYSLSLLSLAMDKKIISGSPLAFGERGVKERIKNVMNFKKPSRVAVALAVTLASVLSVGFVTNRQTSANEVPATAVKADDVERLYLPTDSSADIVTVIIWKNTDGQTQYSLFGGETIPAPSEFERGRVFGGVKSLNAALAEYPQDSISLIHVKHTSDFSKEEMLKLTDAIIVPSRNYSKATGLYEFHITTLVEAEETIKSHYPEATAVRYTGEEEISYTNPPAPVEVYIFEVSIDNEAIICAVSKERGIFFTFDNGEWFAFTGLRIGEVETRRMTLVDIKAIAEKLGPNLKMSDLSCFAGTDIGSGLFIMRYEIDDSDYVLLVGSGNMDDVWYAYLQPNDNTDIEEAIDIRYYDVNKFITDGTKALLQPLPSSEP